MSTTQIVNQIDKNDSFPISQSITAENNCGSISLIFTDSYTDQMIMELPTLNFSVFMEDGTKLISVDFDMLAYTTEHKNIDSIETYSIPLYNLPKEFTLKVTPLFDNNALNSHNEQISIGDVPVFNTTNKGIVDTNINNYNIELWNIPTFIFPINIYFDDSNIVPGDVYTKTQTDALLSTKAYLSMFTPMTQDEYDALENKDLPIYIVYEE